MSTTTTAGARAALSLGVVVVLVSLGAVPVPEASGTGAAPARAGTCAVVSRGPSGYWVRQPVPDFPAGPPDAVSQTVAATGAPDRLLTNGVSVLGSDDGCRWREVWRLPDAPRPDLPAASATDRVLEVVGHPRDPDLVWAVVAIGDDVAARVGAGVPLTPAADESRDPTQTVVLTSRDGGETWSAGRPVPGTPGRLAPAASEPSLLRLPTSSGLHVSTDAGRSWTPRPAALVAPSGEQRPLDGVHGPLVTEVTVDPARPSVLMGRTTTAVRSTDGGLTWSAYGLPPGHVTGPVTSHQLATARPVFATQETSTEPVRDLFIGDGSGLQQHEVAGRVEGVLWRGAWSAAGDRALLATWDRGNGAAFSDVSLYAVTPDGGLADANDLDLPDVLGVEADARGDFHLHTRSELVRLTRDRPDVSASGQVELQPFGSASPAPPAPARLDAPDRIAVDVGDRRTLDVGLDLPRRPTPLDVFFLLDTSNSFEPDIQDVAEAMAGVVESLRAAGIDAHFGVGELGTTEGRRYRLHADIAAPGTALRRGFERLRTGGGSEAHLIALEQTATGSGVGGGTGPVVAPGQDPSWRPGARRTVVVVTDVEYGDLRDPATPEPAAVHRALNDSNVRVIGLEVVREGGDDGVPGSYAGVEAADAAGRTFPTPARRDLEATARATGSLAPPGGVDCRGNGTVELREGDPLVCTTTALRVADLATTGDVLRRVLLAQTDRRPVTLTASGPGAATVQPVEQVVRGVDVLRDQRLDLALQVGCGDGRAGERLPLVLTASLGPAVVARTTSLVACGPAADVAPPPQQQAPGATPGAPVPPPEVVAPPGAAVPGLAPPPVPVSSGGSATASSPGSATSTSTGTSPGSATGTQGAPGVAVHEETSPAPEVARVHASDGDRSGSPGGTPVLAAGALAAGAALWARRRRPGPALAPHRPTTHSTRGRRP